MVDRPAGGPGGFRVIFDVNVYLDLAELFGTAPADLAASVAYAQNRHGDMDVYPHHR